VLFAVCSFTREESIDVPRAVPELKIDPTLPGADDDGFARIGPWLEGAPDSYAAVRLFRV
jgi:hypothetical protein